MGLFPKWRVGLMFDNWHSSSNTSTLKKKNYNNLNWCRKSILESSTSISDKHSQQTSNTREFTQAERGLPWKPAASIIRNGKILNALVHGQKQDRNACSHQFYSALYWI